MKHISIRLSDDSHAMMVAHAKSEKKSLSEFMRENLERIVQYHNYDNFGLLHRLVVMTNKSEAEILFLSLLSVAKSKGLDVSMYN